MSDMNGSLLGISGWDPFGESMLSIIRHIEIANSLSRNDLGELFGNYGRNSFTTVRRSNPDNQDSIDLAKFLQTTRWKADDLSACFSDYFALYRGETSIKSKDSYLDNDIRICPFCAAAGIHLLCHQIIALKKCPLHQEKLTYNCPTCQWKIGNYNYSVVLENDSVPVSGCSNCGNGSISPKMRALSANEKKRAILEEFKVWLNRVNRSFSDASSKHKIVGIVHPFRDILQISRLHSGPDWINECFDNQTFYKKKIARLEGRYSPAVEGVSRPSERIFGDTCLLDRNIELIPVFITSAKNNAKRIASKIEALGITTKRFEIGLYSAKINRVKFKSGRQVKASSTAFFIWKKIIRSLTEIDTSVDGILDLRSVSDIFGEVIDPIYCWRMHWRAGPGGLLWIQNSNDQWSNVDLHRRFCDLWWEFFLENTFLYIYLWCLHEKTHNSEAHALTVNEFITSARLNGVIPIFDLENTKDGITVTVISRLPSIDKVKPFIKKDLPGNMKIDGNIYSPW